MRLNDLLAEKKTSILEKWFDLIIESYPPDTAKFLKDKQNRFTNPVGATISKGISDIFDALLNGSDSVDVNEFLDNVIRIRAVQDFSPSQALSFMFLLKKVIRGELNAALSENALAGEMSALESRIDELSLSAFDIYMKCREKLYEIRANEVKSMTFRLLQRANLICELQDDEKELMVSNNINIKRGEVKK